MSNEEHIALLKDANKALHAVIAKLVKELDTPSCVWCKNQGCNEEDVVPSQYECRCCGWESEKNA